ncbi:glycine cleavage system aminomethyltransferase GcvT [Planococcus halotolerans]|uniref:Aminomethyltransferase n=1 Tax=Planococcus halotolerans TaxID=2233542 RepID=A0A365KU40_9BACL|nr:glycine cleavage system aminomethyltransferase GcvT [Planococcus halotolerans]QHJ71464.1 glycine cleavage system aminomethyltransferase GcvT [Planococcus halotolerans]RAZ76682.1 glycine cleavage system aminomethyltransferase GcvT [Planococcus halotolerans]
MGELQRTPLFESYSQYGGKTIDFGGWELPVQFSSIKDEHEAVRTKAGLFDVSHMGEILVSGPNSLDFLQNLLTNDISKIKDGQAQYTAMCYPDGGTVDDLLTYRFDEQHYMLVVNASNIEKDFDWMQKHSIDGVELENVSDRYGLLALQGPLAETVLQRLTDENLSDIKPFRFKQDVAVAGHPVLISRTGYTGENGFEIYGSPEATIALWDDILKEGKGDGVIPAGLGARDTLRFEACLALYGQELTKDITPLEAGINFVVKLAKDDFIGKEALAAQKENGVPRKLVGIEMIDKGIPRHGYAVYLGDEKIGEVTTGTQSPSLKKNIGLALISAEHAELGKELEVEIRNKRLKAVTVETPFYKRSN